MSGVIGRSANPAILLRGLTRYTTGLQIELAARCRLDPDLRDGVDPTVDAEPFVGGELPQPASAVDGRHSWNSLAAHWGENRGDRGWSSTLWSTPASPPGDPVLVALPARRVWVEFHRGCRSTWIGGRGGRGSYGRASPIGRIRPFSRRRPMYRPGAGFGRVLPAIETDEPG